VYFLICCSSPVKKYIRMQLYKHHPVIESTAGEHFVTHDVKDCLIADRVDQAKISVPVLFLNNAGPDFSPIFILPALISIAFLLFFSRVREAYTGLRARRLPLSGSRRYLLLRHIQV